MIKPKGYRVKREKEQKLFDENTFSKMTPKEQYDLAELGLMAEFTCIDSQFDKEYNAFKEKMKNKYK